LASGCTRRWIYKKSSRIYALNNCVTPSLSPLKLCAWENTRHIDTHA
jgi:hypothetical protein